MVSARTNRKIFHIPARANKCPSWPQVYMATSKCTPSSLNANRQPLYVPYLLHLYKLLADNLLSLHLCQPHKANAVHLISSLICTYVISAMDDWRKDTPIAQFANSLELLHFEVANWPGTELKDGLIDWLADTKPIVWPRGKSWLNWVAQYHG